jgi:putative membrane protein
MNTKVDLDKKYKPIVIILSIVIPVVVTILFGVKVEGVDLSFLPPVYASINGITAILLIAAVLAIKKGKVAIHQKLITIAVICSVSFLAMYVAYHMTSDSTVYGDIDHNGERSLEETANVGKSLLAYTIILISHIILSLIVLPLVMMTYLKGWSGKVEQHKKWAKKTFPIWLYVAISGVVVYLMIAPYY